MGKRIRRVAVIGTGPAGAIATDALAKEQAFDVIRVFERKSVPGGTWVYSPELTPRIPSLRALLEQTADQPVQIPSNFPSETDLDDAINSHQIRYSESGIHENLHSNLPPETMSFTQEPIPEILSERTLTQYGRRAPFRHREVIRDWIENIFIEGNTRDLIEFDTTVERAQKKGDQWILTLRKTLPEKDRNYWWQETFDALVVASGHFSLPYIPEIPGLAEYDERYPGRIRHSKHFRSKNEFKGKRVIVVGGSVSAFDALHEVRLVAKRPVIASLKEPMPAFGWGAFTHPHIAIKPTISRFNPEDGSIEFSDGTSVDQVDIVLFATGYDFSFPFLQDTIKVRNRRIEGLYQHIFNINDPTLAFIGMVTGGLTFRVFEWQAVATARLFAGRAVLPSRKDMEKWTRDRILKCGSGMLFFNLAPDFEEYFEGLRMLAGEPGAGTTGRRLPKYDPKWLEAFQGVIKARLDWWERERRKAEEPVEQVTGVRL